jgi:hypothetical protein
MKKHSSSFKLAEPLYSKNEEAKKTSGGEVILYQGK